MIKSTSLHLDFKTLIQLGDILGNWMIQPRSSLSGSIRELETKFWASRDEFRVIVHYLVEIVRYWSSIHFVINKTNRSLKNLFENADKNPWLYFLTYLLIWEQKSISKSKLNKIFSVSEFKLYDRFVKQLQHFSWKIALEDKTDTEKLSIQEAIPTFVIDHLMPVLSWERIQSEIHALNKDPTDTYTTFRINLLAVENSMQNFDKMQTIIADIEKSLREQNIDYEKDAQIPFLYHIPTEQRINLMHTYYYEKNVVIFQDKASVAVAMIMDPQPGDLILDLTAAPGMKSALISQLVNNQINIIAIEIQNDRCKMMKNLLINMHCNHIHPLNSDGLHPPFRNKIENRFDRILLDAPCTGSGTFLVSPDLKWQQNQQFLIRNIVLQQQLLKAALYLLTPGSFLVYSTCSIFPEEGEQQILHLQTDENWKNQIEFSDLPSWILPPYSLSNLSTRGVGRLFPSIHHSQGFFMVKLRKKK